MDEPYRIYTRRSGLGGWMGWQIAEEYDTYDAAVRRARELLELDARIVAARVSRRVVYFTVERGR